MKQNLQWFLDRVGRSVYCKHSIAFTGNMEIKDIKHAHYLHDVSQNEQEFEFEEAKEDAPKMPTAEKVVEEQKEKKDSQEKAEAPETKNTGRHSIDCSAKSSNINKVGYDYKLNVLEVEFKNGKRYQYSGFPADQYGELQRADSIGGFVNKAVVRKYETNEVKELTFSIL